MHVFDTIILGVVLFLIPIGLMFAWWPVWRDLKKRTAGFKRFMSYIFCVFGGVVCVFLWLILVWVSGGFYEMVFTGMPVVAADTFSTDEATLGKAKTHIQTDGE